MNEVNYAETIILPYLQRKHQELTNQVLVLEVNLMVEQEKVKRLSEQIKILSGQPGIKETPSKKKKTESVMDGETY